MLKWINEAEIKTYDLAWEAIALSIRNILNTEPQQQALPLSTDLIAQSELTINRKNQANKLAKIEHGLSAQEIELLSLSNEQFIYILDKCKAASQQLQDRKECIKHEPFAFREGNLRQIIELRQELIQIKTTLRSIATKIFLHKLNKNMSQSYLSSIVLSREKTNKDNNGFFCHKLFNFLADDKAFIDSLQYLSDYTIVESDEIYIIPNVLVPIFESIQYWLYWFPSCFTWYTNNILQASYVDWEIIAAREQTKAAESPLVYMENFASHIHKLNKKIKTLKSIYNSLWPGFSYFKRSMIERYVTYLQEEKNNAINAYFTKINQPDFLPENISAEETIAILNKTHTPLTKKILKINKDYKNNLLQAINNKALQLFIEGVLSAGKDSFRQIFYTKLLVFKLIKNKQADRVTDKIFKILNHIESKKTLTDNELNSYCHYIAIAYLPTSYTNIEISNFKNHLYNAIKTKKKTEHLDYKNDAKHIENASNISIPYWQQQNLDSAPISNTQQEFVLNNWFNKTQIIAAQQIENILFSHKDFLTLITRCKKDRPDLFLSLITTFAKNLTILLVKAIEHDGIVTNELLGSLSLLKKKLPQDTLAAYSELLRRNFGAKILKDKWSTNTLKTIEILAPDLSKKYFLVGLKQSLTDDEVGQEFYRCISFNSSIFKLLGTTVTDREIVNTIINKALNDHWQNGNIINNAFIYKLMLIENFKAIYISSQQQSKINLLIKMERCINTLENLSMSHAKIWLDTLIESSNLTQAVSSTSDQAANLFLQRIFLTCSMKWKNWLMQNNFEKSVLKATNLEKNILIPIRSTNVEQYRFSKIFTPWYLICLFKAHISSAGLNILTAIRTTNILIGKEHQFYIAILQLGLYTQDTYDGIKTHCKFLLSLRAENSQHKKAIIALRGLLNKGIPYFLPNTDKIYCQYSAKTIAKQIYSPPLLGFDSKDFDTTRTFFQEEKHTIR